MLESVPVAFEEAFAWCGVGGEQWLTKAREFAGPEAAVMTSAFTLSQTH